MSSIITYVFKIIGALVISALLWGLFMGVPDSNEAIGSTDTVTTGTYVNRGSAFEQLVYGNRKDTHEVQGFKAFTIETWLAGTAVNGLMTAAVSEDTWNEMKNLDTTGAGTPDKYVAVVIIP